MNDTIVVRATHRSPAVTPQALAWHAGNLWMGSRDGRRIYQIDPAAWQVRREFDAQRGDSAGDQYGNDVPEQEDGKPCSDASGVAADGMGSTLAQQRATLQSGMGKNASFGGVWSG